MSGEKNVIPPEAIAALERGSRIEAIKAVRISAGLGLKEAKDAVEAYMETNSALKERCLAAEKAGNRGCLGSFILLIGAAALVYLIASGRI